MYLQYLQNLLQENQIPYQTEAQFAQHTQLQNQSNSAHKTQKPPLATNLQFPLISQLAERYSRQMLLSQISYEGQLKLLRSKVAIIGSGGVGCPVAMYLAAAGVGTLGLFDSDVVEMTNLHRQVGHSTCRIGMEKTESLKRTLQSINPHVAINKHPFVKLQTLQALDEYDFVIDGSDNPGCRYMVNDYSVGKGKKVLSGACVGWEAQIAVFGGENLCYRCLWGDEQVSSGGCSALGVVGMLPGLVGLLLGIEAIKLIVKSRSSLEGRMLTFDGRKCEFKRVALRKKVPNCIACGANKLQMQSYDYAKHNLCAKVVPPEVKEITWGEYIQQRPSSTILDVRPSNLYQIVHLANSRNIPYEVLATLDKQQVLQLLGQEQLQQQIAVSCVRGNTSRLAVKYLQGIGVQSCSIKGGILAYRQLYDFDIPQL